MVLLAGIVQSTRSNVCRTGIDRKKETSAVIACICCRAFHMERAAITDAQRAQFVRDGYIVLPGVVPDAARLRGTSSIRVSLADRQLQRCGSSTALSGRESTRKMPKNSRMGSFILSLRRVPSLWRCSIGHKSSQLYGRDITCNSSTHILKGRAVNGDHTLC